MSSSTGFLYGAEGTVSPRKRTGPSGEECAQPLRKSPKRVARRDMAAAYTTEDVGYERDTDRMSHVSDESRTGMNPVPNWAVFATAEPDLARTVEERFGAFTHHVLATLRKDGSPRTTGIEVRFLNGELWLGMMPDSLKALDLRRDPRFSLQANPGSGTEM